MDPTDPTVNVYRQAVIDRYGICHSGNYLVLKTICTVQPAIVTAASRQSIVECVGDALTDSITTAYGLIIALVNQITMHFSP